MCHKRTFSIILTPLIKSEYRTVERYQATYVLSWWIRANTISQRDAINNIFVDKGMV